MPIRVGENPEGIRGLNKFITTDGEGHRGVILAISRNSKEAIVLALNGSRTGSVKWGELYLLREQDDKSYPKVVKKVDCIPPDGNWKIPEWITSAFP